MLDAALVLAVGCGLGLGIAMIYGHPLVGMLVALLVCAALLPAGRLQMASTLVIGVAGLLGTGYLTWGMVSIRAGSWSDVWLIGGGLMSLLICALLATEGSLGLWLEIPQARRPIALLGAIPLPVGVLGWLFLALLAWVYFEALNGRFFMEGHVAELVGSQLFPIALVGGLTACTVTLAAVLRRLPRGW